MGMTRKQQLTNRAVLTSAERIAAIEADRAAFAARCDALVAASLVRDARVCALLGH